MSTKKIISFLAAGGLLGGMVMPLYGHAQTTSTQAQLEVIAQLLQQIKDLERRTNELRAQKTALNEQVKEEVGELLDDLSEGSRGDKVKVLQALLAADPEIYPEGLVSGFFGRLTSAAVKKFQKKNGIASVGRVGPKTREKLNEMLKKNPVAFEEDADDQDEHSDKKERRPCAKVPPGHLVAPGWLRKNQPPIVPLCQKLPPGILTKLGTSTPPSVTSTDVTAPIISGVHATSTASSSSRIFWDTNESATGKVWYGTSTSVAATGTTAMVSTSSFATSHDISLAGLSASTTYYFVVESADASGNVARGAESMFTTLAQ